MNLKKVTFLLIIVLFNLKNYAQSNLLNATLPKEIGLKTTDQIIADNDKPLAYGYVDDRDILWSKMVWEYIDLNEKINLPYYYPIDASKNRKSLFDTLLTDINKGIITEFYDDSDFQHKINARTINQLLTKIDTTDIGIEKANFGEELTPEDLIISNINASHIEGFKIKGLYYFDKRQGEIKYRLLGIAPVSPDISSINDDFSYEYELEELVPLFWIWYPNARKSTHSMKVFNSKNAAYPISYDMLLNAKRFSSIIYKEENVYGNREVAAYIKGNSLMQVLESNHIKNKIRNFELDMWNY